MSVMIRQVYSGEKGALVASLHRIQATATEILQAILPADDSPTSSSARRKQVAA